MKTAKKPQEPKAGTVRLLNRRNPDQTRRMSPLVKYFCRDWQLHLLILLPVIYLIIFKYAPMYGIQIAFRDYSPKKGITDSTWVSWKWFIKFLTNYDFKRVFSNTLILSLYNILVTFPLPIIFALLVNSIRNEKFKKFTQTITYIPHFLSTVVVIAIMNMIFNPINGLYAWFYEFFGGVGYPHDFRGTAESFRHLYVWSDVWKNLGWDSIIYIAALSAVSQEHHEAAMIDGATRLQRIIHVDLPSIMPTVCIMLIMRFGWAMSIGFEKVYLMQSPLNLSTSEVISTYVYKVGMGSPKDFSYGTAIGLFNSVINCVLLVIVNTITKKASNKEVSLF
jgi:putative aldouronate transport system permease protein